MGLVMASFSLLNFCLNTLKLGRIRLVFLFSKTQKLLLYRILKKEARLCEPSLDHTKALNQAIIFVSQCLELQVSIPKDRSEEISLVLNCSNSLQRCFFEIGDWLTQDNCFSDDIIRKFEFCYQRC